MQFSYISAALATLALSNAVALPQPADYINELEVRDPQIGIGVGVGVSVEIDAQVSAAVEVVKQQCTNWSCGCSAFQTCFTQVCDAHKYSAEVVAGLKAKFDLSVNIGIGVGIDIAAYKQAIIGYCQPLTNSCFESYCAQQGYSLDVIAQLRVELGLSVSVGS
ncbi:uncharacterized protein MYCFIDRAFT_211533 [Pseudocercospora fijiensis CIRAD86]|uniref:Hydrophobin n=1 Tax=Pseudocercospora fijiensis (strain CIRAD86) TaxID=383855 RepID=M2ZSP6_PSEFD|nr:uncharacterized protein MYCFIDRAFT_211533 [Pseudocercospora fijiensis CIRAD86]EME82039.1 hypothetical protein MYCFIDRAFT_211533 [Pseudocercospora fijiensis CIRAD86]